jgi:hypothetical protein
MFGIEMKLLEVEIVQNDGSNILKVFLILLIIQLDFLFVECIEQSFREYVCTYGVAEAVRSAGNNCSSSEEKQAKVYNWRKE